MSILTKDLVAEIQNLLKEEYLANVSAKDDTITLTFLNGQTFYIDVKMAVSAERI